MDHTIVTQAPAAGQAVKDASTLGVRWLDGLMNSGPFWGFSGVIVTQLANWVWAARRAKTDDRTSAAQSLVELVNAMREDVARLRIELHDERDLRRQAEEEVHKLRLEVENLRAELANWAGVPGAPAKQTA
jgi:uncharacterized protein YlxW (UPF0749 family)